MADPAAEARIRDLQRRLELDPSSRLFVALAEELRKVGRYSDALSALQKGLLAHPNYVSAQVALGRVYLESGQVTEAIATFSRALTSDPGNLVSAKSLADIYLSRGDGVEAIKKYKLYRALSGDRRVDDIVVKLERELAPPPPPPRTTQTELIPPPPSFGDAPPPKRITKIEPRPMWNESAPVASPSPPPKPTPAETLDIAAVAFEPSADDSYPHAAEMPPVLSRDTPLWPTVKPVAPTPPPPPVPAAPPPPPAPPPGAEADVKTRALRISEILGEATLTARPPRPAGKPVVSAPEPSPPAAPTPAPIPWPSASAPSTAVPPPAEPFPQAPAAASADTDAPRGRTLADLYFAQGHYAEALGIYDDLVLANPGDEEIKRLRRDAEARLLPASRTPEAAEPDPGLGQRLARIRVLKQWLSVVQAR